MLNITLPCCYAHGFGVTQDNMEAVKWYRKAAEQNDAEAQWSLGICYGNGIGVATNFVEAASGFAKLPNKIRLMLNILLVIATLMEQA